MGRIDLLVAPFLVDFDREGLSGLGGQRCESAQKTLPDPLGRVARAFVAGSEKLGVDEPRMHHMTGFGAAVQRLHCTLLSEKVRRRLACTQD